MKETELEGKEDKTHKRGGREANNTHSLLVIITSTSILLDGFLERYTHKKCSCKICSYEK